MKSVFLWFFVLVFISPSIYAALPSVKNEDNVSKSMQNNVKLDQVLKKQDEILKQLDEMKKELTIVKYRCSNN